MLWTSIYKSLRFTINWNLKGVIRIIKLISILAINRIIWRAQIIIFFFSNFNIFTQSLHKQTKSLALVYGAFEGELSRLHGVCRAINCRVTSGVLGGNSHSAYFAFHILEIKDYVAGYFIRRFCVEHKKALVAWTLGKTLIYTLSNNNDQSKVIILNNMLGNVSLCTGTRHNFVLPYNRYTQMFQLSS